jgi:hypothetical protein
MTSSIDTIRRLAGLSPGEYTIPERKDMITTIANNAKSKGLSAEELEQYNVFPIIDINRDKITYVVNPESVSYNESKSDTSKLNKEDKKSILRREINSPTGDHIVIICRNSSDSMKLPTANFWCESVNSDYISNVTQAQPLLDSYQGRFLWYYGIKKSIKPKKGGHPRRRGTFRQQRFKRTTSKSRRRATRRTHRRV